MVKKPLISLIAAMSENRVIGRDNRLPWHLPADLQHFKKLTLGKPIIMGRKTWESLPGLLPERNHIVLSRNRRYQAEGAILVRDLEKAVMAAGEVAEIFIVGGATIYEQALATANRIYLTLIHAQIEGDAFFPRLDEGRWRLVLREDHPANGKNPLPYSFLNYERRGA
ncbi:MAG: dihydrofolate reductase [Gammaproteobacteria bacterium RIFOXYA12_FULL_61_12]|nr:MAG: dihydrofolate reductase [Gammaproteobacteria bacterium RIFOXYA12_FULL_61_12]OGT91721.1 MAG: dihydrofolate reductase [Gammaproteobacteria bacterium RIFOXYD12_FULL_61_37]